MVAKNVTACAGRGRPEEIQVANRAVMSGIIDVTLRRDRWTGQMIYSDGSTPLGYVEMAVHRATVMAAAGVPVLEGLYQQLLAVSDSLRGLDDRTVRQPIDKAWGRSWRRRCGWQGSRTRTSRQL